jgi:hypothetical protein
MDIEVGEMLKRLEGMGKGMMKKTLLSNRIDASSSRIDILRNVPYSHIFTL